MIKVAIYDKPASKTFKGLEDVIFIGNHDNGDDIHGTATNWVAQQQYKKYGQGLDIKQYAYSSRNGFVQFIDWCISNEIDVMSISWNLPCTKGDIYDIALQKALDKGIIVIASAGNDGKDDKELSWPGRDPRVIAVGAWDYKSNTIAGYSSWGANVFVVDDGNYSISNVFGNTLTGDGTSFSTPRIAMDCAIWKSQTNGTREQFCEFIKKYSKDVMQPGRDNASGYGLFSWPIGWKPEDDIIMIEFTIGSNIVKYNNNTELKIDVAPFIQNGRTFLPVRVLAELLDCEVEWDETNRKVKITKMVRG